MNKSGLFLLETFLCTGRPVLSLQFFKLLSMKIKLMTQEKKIIKDFVISV